MRKHITNIEWQYFPDWDSPRLVLTWGSNSSIVDEGNGKSRCYYKETGADEFGLASPVLSKFIAEWKKEK